MPDPTRPELPPIPAEGCPCTIKGERDPACKWHGDKSTFESFAAHFPEALCGKQAPTIDGVRGGSCVLKKHGKDVKHSWER